MQPQDHEPDEQPRKPTDAERAFYEKFKREFSAADLQLYTELDKGVPAEQVLAELEELQRQDDANKKAS